MDLEAKVLLFTQRKVEKKEKFMGWILKDLDSDRSYELRHGDILGRSEGSHQFPDATKMSRSHCQVVIEHDRLYLIDLESRNGTYVNSQKVEPQKKIHLTDKSIIMFGNKTFMLKLVEHTNAIHVVRKKTQRAS